jgi:hypothetical protein
VNNAENARDYIVSFYCGVPIIYRDYLGSTVFLPFPEGSGMCPPFTQLKTRIIVEETRTKGIAKPVATAYLSNLLDWAVALA